MKLTNFTTRFKWYKHQKKLKTKELADIMGVTSPQISQWAHGKNMPNAGALVHLAEVFDCSLEDLLGIQSRPNSKNRPPDEELPPDWETIIKNYKEEIANLKEKVELLQELISVYKIAMQNYKDNEKKNKT